MQIGRYRIGWYPTMRIEWWRGCEYWDRLILGPIYVLRGPRWRRTAGMTDRQDSGR